MKLIVFVIAVLVAVVTADPILGNALGTNNGIDDAVAGVLTPLFGVLNGLVSSVSDITATIKIDKSFASVLNKLTGALSDIFSSIHSILDSLPLNDVTGAKDAIGRDISIVECILIELVQIVNFADSANLMNRDGVIGNTEEIATSLTATVNGLLETVIQTVSSVAPVTEAAAAKVVALVLILESVIAMVSNVLNFAEEIIVEATSALVSAAATVIDQVLSSVNLIVAELSSSPSQSINGIVPSLRGIAAKLNAAVTSLLSSASEIVSETVESLATSGSVSDVSSLKIDVNLSRNIDAIAPALNEVHTIIINSIIYAADSTTQGVIEVVQEAVSDVFNSIATVVAIVAATEESPAKSVGSVSEIENILTDALHQLVADLQGVVNSILSIANYVTSVNVANVFRNIVAAVIEVAKEIVEALGCLLDGLFASINDISISLPGIQSECLSKILSSLEAITCNVSASLSDFNQSVSGTLTGVIGSPAGIIGSLSGTLAGVSGALISLSRTTSRSSGAIEGTAGGFFEDLLSVIQTVIGPVTGSNAQDAVVLARVAADVVVIVATLDSILSGFANIDKAC